MAPDPNFLSQVLSLQKLLESTRDTYNNTYSTQLSNSGSSNVQLTGLEQTLVQLRAKLANVRKISDTYDREYLDRLADKPLNSFWRLRGVSTLQDWVLLIFFLIYGIISLSLVVAVVMFSSAPVFNGVMLLGASFSIAVMIVGVIVRFA
jgi:hypothetical protein